MNVLKAYKKDDEDSKKLISVAMSLKSISLCTYRWIQSLPPSREDVGPSRSKFLD